MEHYQDNTVQQPWEHAAAEGAVKVTTVAMQNAFINKVYLWMCTALALSAVAAWMVISRPALMQMVAKGFIVLAIAEVALVIWLTAAIRKISASTAAIGFVAYSVLNGLTLSPIFAIYTQSSIVTTFLAASLTFGVCGAAGYAIKGEMSGFGRLLLVALIGLLVGSLVNFFIGSQGFETILTYGGVLIFAGLAAYDTNQLKHMSRSIGSVPAAEAQKLALIGALSLYLDFINLFLYLLRIFGRRD
ncbi:MAG: Bax inhibitor-1/YccA family protein [Lentisphaeria bacterium]|nr:Bax inhibitor-1/YccA family protein [Lentisphaeria bacterium]